MVMPLWSNEVTDQEVVVWQLAQSAVVATCPAGLPGALVPLWQEAQVPVTCVWSTRVTGVQASVVRWHASQTLLLAMCDAGLPGAVAPLWHEMQFPVMPV